MLDVTPGLIYTRIRPSLKQESGKRLIKRDPCILPRHNSAFRQWLEEAVSHSAINQIDLGIIITRFLFLAANPLNRKVCRSGTKNTGGDQATCSGDNYHCVRCCECLSSSNTRRRSSRISESPRSLMHWKPRLRNSAAGGKSGILGDDPASGESRVVFLICR